MRSFDIGAVTFEENWEGYRDWTEASEWWSETDAGSVCTPSIAFEDYTTTGQRQHLLLTINNTSGSTQSVTIGTQGSGLGVWVPNTVLNQVAVTVSFRYKASAGMDGATAMVHAANSPFGIDVSEAIVADGEWHTVSGTWEMQSDSVLFASFYHSVTGITNGMTGTVRFDDFRCVRVGNIQREIDNTVPVIPLRCDWGEGYRETYGWVTALQQAEDGSEYREQLRMVPTCRLEYSVIGGDAAKSGLIDQTLYRYQGQLVAVPRWSDAVPFASTASSGHEIFTSDDFTSRWFQPRQRFMVWESETNYEVEIIDTINSTRITLDPGEGALTGTFTAGVAKIVPLVPARFAPQIALSRPNNLTGIYPLAFDVQMVQ